MLKTLAVLFVMLMPLGGPTSDDVFCGPAIVFSVGMMQYNDTLSIPTAVVGLGPTRPMNSRLDSLSVPVWPNVIVCSKQPPARTAL